MPARLIIESDIDNSRQEISFDRPRITIGRKPGNDLHFNRPEISGSHAAFLLENDNYYVTDLGSTNGTLLNGAPIVAKEKYPLNPMDVVTIAPYRIRFEGEPGATIMEAIPPEAASLRRPSGTEPNLGQRTGTAEHEKEPPEAAAAPPAPDPRPAEEVAPEPPKEKAETPKVEEEVSTAPPVEVKEKGGYEIYIWLGFGAIFVLLAIGLIVLLFGV
ncbi:FHA domain-containing protein [bacterium]|nr:FHA domain-containing protein [bacterium]